MPLKFHGEQRVVHCINEQLPGHTLLPGEFSTMVMNHRFFATLAIVPPIAGRVPDVDLTYAAPARMFHCRACGYMEMYSAMVVDAHLWQTTSLP